MKSDDLGKLERIKMKYCCSYSTPAASQPKTEFFRNQAKQGGIQMYIQQRINSNKLSYQHNHLHSKPQSASNAKSQKDNTVLNLNELSPFSKVNPNKCISEDENINQNHNSLRVLRQSNKFTNKDSDECKRNQSIVQCYEKTYDLIKNYRRKIKSTFEIGTEPQTQIFQINICKKLLKHSNKQNKLTFEQKKNSPNINLTHNEQKQSSAQVEVKTKINLLQTISMKRNNELNQLSNIQSLQNKIQPILGIK